MEESLRTPVNETKRITEKFKELKFMRNLHICKEEEDEAEKEMSSHFSFLLEKVRCLVRERRTGDLWKES